MQWRALISLSLSIFGSLLMIGAVFLLLTLISGGVAPAKAQMQSVSPAALLSKEGDNRFLNNYIQQSNPQNLPHLQAATTVVAWDDADSHHWIGEPWGDDIEVDWVEFGGRKVLRAVAASVVSGWGLMRTDAFPAENWETKTALRADIYLAGAQSNLGVKLEVRENTFNPPLEEILCPNLQPNTWTTCTWIFSDTIDYSAVAHLSLVFDKLSGNPPTFYVDNLRLVSGETEEEWDDMDSDSRQWFYFGNWLDWSPGHLFGLEAISHNGGHPTSPAGSIYLQWDYQNGCCYPETKAEIGTQKLADLTDWSSYTRLVADVKVSNPDAPISIFFWDEDAQNGHVTPARTATATDTWQTISWSLDWPAGFNSAGIDKIHFVVGDIDLVPTGTLYLDNILLVSSPITGIEYIFENFNDRNETYTDFQSNWGPLNGSYIITATDTNVRRGNTGASLKVTYTLPVTPAFTGLWYSLWGHSDYTQTQYLDFTDIYRNLNSPDKDFEELRFWVRGSDATTGTHKIKVELKDTRNVFSYTAYTYITIDDSDTTWQEIVLDADVTNASFWSYNANPPDPTRMKQLVFVIENNQNPSTGAFYIDDIRFVDVDDYPFDPNQHTDDEFLDFVSQKTFLYFLDGYDPQTGLFRDRLTFPDLMSTAATGFGLTALTIGESRGWITRPLAEEMVLRTLRALRDGQTATNTVTDAIVGTNGYKGYYYHFLGLDGLRKDTGSELSPVDTALLMAGVLTVREYFNDVPEIVSLSDELYRRVEWGWMLDQNLTVISGTQTITNLHYNQFYLAWQPECGKDYHQNAPQGGCFSDYYWDFYTDEVVLLNLLAIGSPTHPVSTDVFYAWFRKWDAYAGHTLIPSWSGSFFTYVFAHLWIDFCPSGRDKHPTATLRVNWWENSVEAARASWQFVEDYQDETCDVDDHYTTYRLGGWLTASDGPDEADPYKPYGTLPAGTTPITDGTVQAYGAGMATMFLPDKAIPTLKDYFTDTDLWRYRFGFGDAYNRDRPDCNGHWYNHTTFGIDQGPMLIAIENYRSGLIWDTFQRNNHIRQALSSVWQCPVYMPIILK